jgi:hypothetical protein
MFKAINWAVIFILAYVGGTHFIDFKAAAQDTNFIKLMYNGAVVLFAVIGLCTSYLAMFCSTEIYVTENQD